MKLALPILLLVVLGMVIAAAPPAENEPIAMEDSSPDTVELLSLPTTNDEDHEGLAKETVEERYNFFQCDTVLNEMRKRAKRAEKLAFQMKRDEELAFNKMKRAARELEMLKTKYLKCHSLVGGRNLPRNRT